MLPEDIDPDLIYGKTTGAWSWIKTDHCQFTDPKGIVTPIHDATKNVLACYNDLADLGTSALLRGLCSTRAVLHEGCASRWLRSTRVALHADFFPSNTDLKPPSPLSLRLVDPLNMPFLSSTFLDPPALLSVDGWKFMLLETSLFAVVVKG